MAVFRGPRQSDDDARGAGAERVPSSDGDAYRLGWVLFRFVRRHRGKLTGLVVGLSIGFGVKYLGFLWTLFIGGCAVVGYFIGKRMDEHQEDLLDLLDRVLPPGRG